MTSTDAVTNSLLRGMAKEGANSASEKGITFPSFSFNDMAMTTHRLLRYLHEDSHERFHHNHDELPQHEHNGTHFDHHHNQHEKDPTDSNNRASIWFFSVIALFVGLCVISCVYQTLQMLFCPPPEPEEEEETTTVSRAFYYLSPKYRHAILEAIFSENSKSVDSDFLEELRKAKEAEYAKKDQPPGMDSTLFQSDGSAPVSAGLDGTSIMSGAAPRGAVPSSPLANETRRSAQLTAETATPNTPASPDELEVNAVLHKDSMNQNLEEPSGEVGNPQTGTSALRMSFPWTTSTTTAMMPVATSSPTQNRETGEITAVNPALSLPSLRTASTSSTAMTMGSDEEGKTEEPAQDGLAARPFRIPTLKPVVGGRFSAGATVVPEDDSDSDIEMAPIVPGSSSMVTQPHDLPVSCSEMDANRKATEDFLATLAGHAADEDDEENVCAICICGYEEGDVVVSSKYCSHMFHKECIMGWLAKNDDCPCCRIQMISEDDVNKAAEIIVQKAREHKERQARESSATGQSSTAVVATQTGATTTTEEQPDMTVMSGSNDGGNTTNNLEAGLDSAPSSPNPFSRLL